MDFDTRQDCLGNGSLLWSGVGGREFGAAGVFHGLEFHKLDTRVIGVIEIKLPFAVTADFWFLPRPPTVCDELLLCRVDVRYSESDVIHDAEGLVIGVCR